MQVFGAAIDALALRIVAEGHGRQCRLGLLPRAVGCQHFGGAEQQPPCSACVPILGDPGAQHLAARASAQAIAEAGHSAVEMDDVGLAGRQFEGRDGLRCELHDVAPGKHRGIIRMAFGDIRRHCCIAHFDRKPLESWRCGTRWHRVTVALRFPASSVSVAGFVELRDESQKSDRFVLRLERIEGNRIVDKPQRVRLSVRRGTAPPAGAFVEAKAQLSPPLQPLRPGSYDFARDLYFQRIGASGFVHGAVKVVTPPAEAGWRLRAVTSVENVRDAIDMRIRSVLSGDVGSIASALITGKRDAITPYLYDAMFVSGIGHVLSISGYHMAVVAGIVFFILRALLALIPGVTDRMPVKMWAALGALVVTALYLVLSGAEVATQRSFIMIAIVLIGVVLDRPVLTLRTVTIAALVVLFLAPEAVVHPSFQMSFAAIYQR